jgi:hypothetical protein
LFGGSRRPGDSLLVWDSFSGRGERWVDEMGAYGEDCAVAVDAGGDLGACYEISFWGWSWEGEGGSEEGEEDAGFEEHCSDWLAGLTEE